MRSANLCKSLIAAFVLAAMSHAAQAKPQIEDVTIAADDKGTIWLGFNVQNPSGEEFPVQLKVVRPVAKAPRPGLPMPVLGPGVRGSWLWVGEGKAALFNLDATDKLTWIVLSPQTARQYLSPQALPPLRQKKRERIPNDFLAVNLPAG